MNRDMDLIRLLLLAYEGDHNAQMTIDETYLPRENGENFIRYHRDMLFDEGLLKLADFSMKAKGASSGSGSVTFAGKVVSQSHNEEHSEAGSSSGAPIEIPPGETGFFVATRTPGRPPIKVGKFEDVFNIRRQEGTLTWPGHDFLDAARNDTLWNKAKSFLTKQGVPLSIELLKTVLAAEAKKLVGIP